MSPLSQDTTMISELGLERSRSGSGGGIMRTGSARSGSQVARSGSSRSERARKEVRWSKDVDYE